MIDTIACIFHRNIALDIVQKDSWKRQLVAFRNKECPSMNNFFFFFWIRGNPTSWKAHFVGPGERVKPRLSQALTKGARPDSNSRPAVQISSPLPSRHAPWG